MSSTLTHGWIKDHYAPAFYMDDDGSVVLADGSVPFKRVIDHAIPTFVCRNCGEPSWSVTCHAAERHGVDVEVRPPLPGQVRPEWMRPDWI